MNAKQIKMNAPDNAVYWSPAVEQYFTRSFTSLAPGLNGKFVVVAKEERGELIKIDDL